jgi:ferric-dicitrate binding protein FerR (iron transport regulator)
MPADDMKAAVRGAVHAEWRATVAKRGRRRVWLALAASVMVAAAALWLSRPFTSTPGEVVANVSRVIGTVESSSSAWSGRTAVLASSPVRAGETLMTGSQGLLALRLPDGVSLRLDRDTRIEWVDAGHVELRSGAVYVDAGTAPKASPSLRVSTPAGVVWHVGTQYEARLVDGATRIRVREGRVDLTPDRGGTTQSAHVGEELLVSASGNVARGAISPSDPAWGWAATAAPSFEIDGRPVHEFLTWVGREVGREVVFATPESQAEAERAVLSGSVAGLAPAEALAAVLPTTSLRSTERDGKIEISLQPR